jgi:ribonuclease-3
MTLEDVIGIKFNNPALLQQAMVHRSYLNESKEFPESNERLEFLGDSVLSILTTEFLYKKFPKLTEGQLTNARSVLVRGKTLAAVARDLGLGKYLLMSRGERDTGGENNSAILADAVEALIGATYLDQGLDVARSFLQKFLYNRNFEAPDYKSEAQKQAQAKLKTSPKYKVISSFGPDHDKTFVVDIYLKDEIYGQGKGKSKQEAEQAAAKIALEKLNSIKYNSTT